MRKEAAQAVAMETEGGGRAGGGGVGLEKGRCPEAELSQALQLARVWDPDSDPAAQEKTWNLGR